MKTLLKSKDILINRLQEISETGVLDAEDADRKENLHRLFMYPAMRGSCHAECHSSSCYRSCS